ncbi:hypothetical protein Baya_13269 [Bagarius yarrelli]|uniref:Uncharacterized protein n=1 Tax=Bagarius yarrelli TaxID=175774 RepID=A0A556V5L9_BAGYA|nr:hypothetical protein Baya_13269 [Bagarius yarrelli]
MGCGCHEHLHRRVGSTPVRRSNLGHITVEIETDARCETPAAKYRISDAERFDRIMSTSSLHQPADR